MHTVTDEQLIHWVASGDASCLATLFERHHRSVFQFCLQMTRNRAQSEDLVQDVFIRLLKRADSFRNEGSFKAWMFNIARNLTLDYLRQSATRRSVSVEDAADVNSLADYRSAEQAAAGSQKMQQVLHALGQLPLAAQEVIWLGRFEFDSYRELGQALACSTGAARVRMHRAMAQLNDTFTRVHGVSIDD
ncbi:MAG: RNA polymerase sigma factor [Pseudomonadota bacterium]